MTTITLSTTLTSRPVIGNRGGGGGLDPDAQAFITAASITDATQITAINQLVVDLKGYGIWTKMKAIYPFVGGTATTHKWNLKDPRDLDAAFRLVFNGGWTHSATGALPNGTNGYADTYLITNGLLNQFSSCMSYYSRTNNNGTYIEMGAGTITGRIVKHIKYSGTGYYDQNDSSSGRLTVNMSSTNSTGLFIMSRTANNIQKAYRNGSQIGTTNTNTITSSLPNFKIYIGAYNDPGGLGYSNREVAFAHISDGLTDTEAANLYTAVQTYQTTLGRSVGPQTVSDPDAQAFVTAADIQDQVQAQAINTLTIDLKNYGIWSKMKAIYPFVGGTASTHKWNLKDPRDLDIAFRLVFNGGWTHSATGAKPNGTNGFANTYLNPSLIQSLNSNGLGCYITQNSSSSSDPVIMGALNTQLIASLLVVKSNLLGCRLNATYIDIAITGGFGNFDSQKTSSTITKLYKNGILQLTGNSGGSLPNSNIFLGNMSINAIPYNLGFVNSEFRLAYISDGLTDTEASNLYIAVQNYQTTLSRQV